LLAKLGHRPRAFGSIAPIRFDLPERGHGLVLYRHWPPPLESGWVSSQRERAIARGSVPLLRHHDPSREASLGQRVIRFPKTMLAYLDCLRVYGMAALYGDRVMPRIRSGRVIRRPRYAAYTERPLSLCPLRGVIRRAEVFNFAEQLRFQAR